MYNDFTGEPYTFGSDAVYRCNQGFYFQNDRTLEFFTTECLENGTFAEPNPWPVCVTGKSNRILQSL